MCPSKATQANLGVSPVRFGESVGTLEGKEVRLRFLRLMVALTLVSATLVACGGGDPESSDDTSGQTSDEVSAETTASGEEPTGTTQSQAGGGTSGDGSITLRSAAGSRPAARSPSIPL